MDDLLDQLKKLEIALRAKANVSFYNCQDEEGNAYNQKADTVHECIQIAEDYKNNYKGELK